MSYVDNYRNPMGVFAARAAADERTDFITKTYLHLAGAIGLFVILEAVLLNLPGIENLVGTMLGGRFSWLIVLGAFMVVSWVAGLTAVPVVSLRFARQQKTPPLAMQAKRRGRNREEAEPSMTAP